jgi:hypothetical protein
MDSVLYNSVLYGRPLVSCNSVKCNFLSVNDYIFNFAYYYCRNMVPSVTPTKSDHNEVLRIRITLMIIRIPIFYFEAYSELNPTLNFDSDPDPASHLNDSFILSLSSS